MNGLVGRRIRGVCIDLSGTLHVEDKVIGKAVSAVARLRQAKLPIAFVTNTTKESRKSLHSRLKRLGFDVHLDEIFTSLTATRLYVEKLGVRPLLFLDDKAKEDFEGVDTSNPNAVVVGLSPADFCKDRMDEAFRVVMATSPRNPIIAVHKGRYYQKGDGLALGPGPFVVGLEYATDTTAHVVGKPEAAFFHAALAGIGVPTENAVMIGDDLRDDVGGALNAGMMAVGVRTGKYRPEDEEAMSNGKLPVPHLMADDFSSAVDEILGVYHAESK